MLTGRIDVFVSSPFCSTACVYTSVCVSKTEKYWLSVSKTGAEQESLGLFDFDALEGGVIEPMMMIIYASLARQPFGQIVSYCFHRKMFTSQQANCCRRLQSFRSGRATSVFLFQTEEILEKEEEEEISGDPPKNGRLLCVSNVSFSVPTIRLLLLVMKTDLSQAESRQRES